MKDITYIAVSGFFGSGSSAVVDLLKEYKGAYECEAEIRTIKDPYGIVELERALINNWELINSAAAIRDFLWLSNICARPGRMPWSRAGLNYNKTISRDYMKITNQYIKKLTSFKYVSDFYYQKFKKPYIKYAIDRCRAKVEFLSNGKIKIANRRIKPSYFAKPTQKEFNIATQEYFNDLFDSHAFENQKTFIILDQAISPNNTQVIHRYFKKAKMIIIDRDPRDIFIEGIRWGECLDKNLNSKQAGFEYVEKHKALRSEIIIDSDILIIRFEELVLDYEQTKNKIQKFLGFSDVDHLFPKKYLIPEKSANNVAIWKKYYNSYKEALDVIEKELPDECWKNK